MEKNINQPFGIRFDSDDVPFIEMKYNFFTPKLRSSVLNIDSAYAKKIGRFQKKNDIKKLIEEIKAKYQELQDVDIASDNSDIQEMIDDEITDVSNRISHEIYEMQDAKNREILNVIAKIDLAHSQLSVDWENVNLGDIADAVEFFRKFYKF